MCKCQRRSQIPTCICTKVLYLPESQKDQSLAGLCARKPVYFHSPAVFVGCQLLLLYSSYLSTVRDAVVKPEHCFSYEVVVLPV